MEKLDSLFNQSMRRIKKLNKGKTFGLGLSGGFDSALTAYYAKKNGLELKCFCFGHKNSDAFRAAKEIAEKLDTNLKLLEIKESFLKKMWKDGISYNPMINLMYLSYCSLSEDLPHFDVLLTGYNGDNLFGSHIKKEEINSKNDGIKYINKKYNLYPLSNFSDRIKENIIKDIAKCNISNKSWINKENFNYNNRQLRFIKNNFCFNYFGRYKQFYSIFAVIDLVEYVLGFPITELYNCKLYHEFIRKKVPILANIRPERKAYKINDLKSIKLIKKALYLLEMKIGINLFYKVEKHRGHLDWKKLIKYDKDFIVNTIKSQIEGNPLEYLKDSFLNQVQKKNMSIKEIQTTYLYVSCLLFLSYIGDETNEKASR